MAAIDRAAINKKVQERREANKKITEERKAERAIKTEAAKEESARKREENRKKMKRGPVYKSKRYAEGGEVSYNWPTRDARNGGKK